MNYTIKKTRKIAIALLLIWSFNFFVPNVALALTSGPAAPEAASFQPAGVSDMVDLQTGDFKYNIPLLDIDGYPINLNYQSGAGVDEEASWVGLGWNLNVGSINRQLRGIPDDMSGDEIETDHETKPKVTIGGKGRVKLEFGGQKTPVKGDLTFSLGVFSDSYTGIGAEIGVNAGVSYNHTGDGPLTAGLGVGVLSNTSNGVTVNASPYINYKVKGMSDDRITTNARASTSIGYNSRSGMKNQTLNASFGPDILPGILQFGGTAVSYNTEPVNPKIQIPYKTTYTSFSLDVGPTDYAAFTGIGGTGYKSVSEVVSRVNKNPAYGSLYAERGKNVKNAVMDFIRENDNPVIPELPNLAIPVNTTDLFSYASQLGGGQFKLFRGGTGMYFDNEVSDQNTNNTAGLDLGFGGYFHGGTSLFHQSGGTTTRKWTNENAYLRVGDFQDVDFNKPNNQHAYFKVIGEKGREDADMSAQLWNTSPLAVALSGKAAAPAFQNGIYISDKIAKHKREPEQTNISYLTAKEASFSGLDRQIKKYPFYTYSSSTPFTPPANHKPVPISSVNRVSDYRKAHHLSEMTVTNADGKRLVYGTPVYQTMQKDYSFAIGKKTDDYTLSGNLVSFPSNQSSDAGLGKGKGIDEYFHCDNVPAYATSFLLSGVLSPDYVDKTGDGITEDDLGTGIKFNYSTPNLNYHWRTPFGNATLNKCLQADPKDDKASIIYGEKELWYMSSIESKTKIAYFITEDRLDGLGAKDFAGARATTQSAKQKCLREIRLYSKADMSKPIKVVKLSYEYLLCPSTPNSTGTVTTIDEDTHATVQLNGGKLTLTRVEFLYGNTTKGSNFPYKFFYNKNYTSKTGVLEKNIKYATLSTDRWGVYQRSFDNTVNTALNNDEFPYTSQDLLLNDPSIRSRADQAASLWNLSKIELPTGGTINVSLEADDYAYVQDKKAMTMARVDNLINAGGGLLGANALDIAKGFQIKISTTTAVDRDATADFKRDYLNGSDYIYSKFYTAIATNNVEDQSQPSDFVSSYAEIDKVIYSGNYAKIFLKDRGEVNPGVNPVVLSAWQKMKEEYPMYAYPGFDKRIGKDGSNGLGSAISAIVTAFANLSELKENFYQKAQRLHYAKTVDFARSCARITKIDGRKTGGGVRVKQITISDDWNEMGGNEAKSYGQRYSYNTTEGGQTISSGVASYEPSIGSDENPLKQPIFYVQHFRGGLDNFFDLQLPFGESFYPSPSVVYSKVTVMDLDKDTDLLNQSQSSGQSLNPQTGYTVNEFYTAREFPVRVSVLPMQKAKDPPGLAFSSAQSVSIDNISLSQGYAIELNDMHGKAKATRVYNQAGALVSSVVYNYNTTGITGGAQRLSNKVNIVNQDGSISQNQVIGRDMEFFTDFREQESINEGTEINVGVDIIPVGPFPIPIPHFPEGVNSEYKLFRSACGVKVIQYYGIIQSVVKMDNGSTIKTENLAFDGKTGDPIVTKTQNEFNKDIYNINIPAYWAYSGMGPASQNLGMMLGNIGISQWGDMGGLGTSYLNEGDKLLDLDSPTGDTYWVYNYYNVFPYAKSQGTLWLINQYGERQYSKSFEHLKIVGSGYKNMLDANTATLVCLDNPIVSAGGSNLRLAIDDKDMTGLKVINASAQTFRNTWSVEVPDIHVLEVSATYTFDIVNSGGPQTGPNTNIGASLVEAYASGSHTYTKTDHDNGIPTYSPYLSQGLVRSSIIDLDYGLISPTSTNVMGAYGTFNAPREGTYYLGFDSNIKMSFTLDCTDTKSYQSHNDDGYWGWTVIPVYLTAGKHNINMEMTYAGYIPGSHTSYGGGIEIYDNTRDEILNAGADGTNIKTIWSSTAVTNTPGTSKYVIRNGEYIYNSKYSDQKLTNYSPCILPTRSINPFLYGFIGNWRPYENKVYQQNRVYNNIVNAANSVVDVKNIGYINNFFSYCYPSTGENPWVINSSLSSKWKTANTVTLYDKYGQQTENMDALQRYSAADFDFNGELPAAVASNARNREIYVNSLEDSYFKPGTIKYFDPPAVNDFIQTSTGLTIKSLVTTSDSHTGKYSASLPRDGVVMSTKMYNRERETTQYLINDEKSQMVKNSAGFGIYPNGFEPLSGKDKIYVFSAWIKDGDPETKSAQRLAVKANGNTVDLTCRAIVEGWKLVEGNINLSNNNTPFTDGTALTILLKPDLTNGQVLIDDIRIHPFNAQMKSYAYDDSTMRLMAEMDENGFATFYEYDSEGQLIRVKRETEKGIVTLKETRLSQKKRS